MQWAYSVCVWIDCCVVDGHSCGPHESDCISGFQMEVVNGNRCAETLMTVGLMHVDNDNCVGEVKGCTCDCDEDRELMSAPCGDGVGK